jgi:transposase
MLYAGLDLSRKRLDFHLLDGEGASVDVGAAPPDVDGLGGLTQRLACHGEPIRAAIESMNGARFVHDRLELAGWQVEIADAQKVKGLAPLACKTDRIDAWVLAELARRDLVPAIWLPDPRVRAERERARWRLHLVRHRSSLKQRVHAVLLTHGRPCPVSDLFGVRGRQLLARLALPEPWQGTIEASLRLIDEFEREIGDCERELRRLGADHRYVGMRGRTRARILAAAKTSQPMTKRGNAIDSPALTRAGGSSTSCGDCSARTASANVSDHVVARANAVPTNASRNPMNPRTPACWACGA